MRLRFIFLLSLVLYLLFSVPFALAAETFFETGARVLAPGQLFEVGVFINTEGDSINAVEGKITFPSDLLEVKNINEGGSVVNFWIEKPKVELGKQITFSGVTPGGYNGSHGLISSITFLTKSVGSGTIKFSEARALLNDGKGTKAPLTVSGLGFSVSEQIQASPGVIPISPAPPGVVPKGEDTDPPESFEPMVARTQAIFDGKYFLVFVSQDKQSGIDHYEVREGKRPFAVAESPHLLQNQNLDEAIIVKAVDKSGNERIVALPPPKPRPWYKNYSIPTILVTVAVVIFYLIREISRILWKRKRQS